MNLYAISDLHLSFGVDKPMDVFGSVWVDYMNKIEARWLEVVSSEDTVILPGDFCWAMYIQEAYQDFAFLEKLPGKKVLLKGNHDYWWSTLNKLNKYILDNNFKTINFLHNNSFEFGDYIVCGTRGWKSPGDNDFGNEDMKIYERELQRLRLSLSTVDSRESKQIIVALHYPPFGLKGQSTGFVEIMREYGVKKCIYGHLHSLGISSGYQGVHEGTEYVLVSADNLNFKPIFLGKY